MKKSGIILIIIIILGLGGFFGKKVLKNIKEKNRIEEIKEGWYVEITNDYINVRDEPDRYSYSNRQVFKGEVYEALKVDLNDPNLYWYQIKFKNGTTGWIANTTSGTYLIDHNNPKDIATPIIKLKEDIYNVISINDINYKHLTTWDDKDDYKLSHIVCHENDGYMDQYWIRYTITDGSGKSSSKLQKIVFEETPSEDDVHPFEDCKK